MMKRFILIFLLTLCTTSVLAEEVPKGLALSEAPIDYTDIASIKRGAKFFANNCMTCHTLTYLRYDNIVKEAGIKIDNKPLSINGVIPPDLSLIADVRGVNWVYTYLQSFYRDKSAPSGFNNLLVPGTAMPAIITPYQGEQELVKNPTYDLLGHVHWYDLVKPVKQGSMPPDQFEETMADLVNFLAYVAEPFRIEQERIGLWVLVFLVFLFVLMYFLKKEYWKDVKKPREIKD